MDRIGAVTACAAALVCIAFNAAWAVNCDDRVIGSCPIEPIVEPAANAATESVTRLAYARAGKERGVRRARRASRYARRVERRRPVKVAQVARTQAAAVPRRQEIAEAPAASAPATILPTVAAILPPTFVRDANLDGSKLEAGWNAAHAPQATLAAALEPAASSASSGPAAAESPVPVQVAGHAIDSGERRAEPMQAAAAGVPEPADTPWMRFAVLAFGGLLAFGSAIRLFV